MMPFLGQMLQMTLAGSEHLLFKPSERHCQWPSSKVVLIKILSRNISNSTREQLGEESEISLSSALFISLWKLFLKLPFPPFCPGTSQSLWPGPLQLHGDSVCLSYAISQPIVSLLRKFSFFTVTTGFPKRHILSVKISPNNSIYVAEKRSV